MKFSAKKALKIVTQRADSIGLKNLPQRLFRPQQLVLSEQLPYQTIATYDKASIRYYAAANQSIAQTRIPIVIVAPLAVTMAIYDLYPNRSLIKHLNHHDFNVYLIDWGLLNRTDHQLDIGYFALKALPHLLDDIKQHAKSNEITLHGWSLGGIFAIFYTATHPDSGVRNLVVMGSPVDTYASGWIGQTLEVLHRLLARSPKALQPWLKFQYLSPQLLHTPGKLNAVGFKMLDPIGSIRNQLSVFKRLHNLEQLQTHTTLSQFLNQMIDYPGEIVRDMGLWYWLDNPTQHGKFDYKGQLIDFHDIHSALLVVAGRNDELATADSIKPLTQMTGSADVTFKLIDGGHIGIISSESSQLEFWPYLSDWLAQRSTIKAI